MYNVFYFIIILSAHREQHSRKLKKSKITYWALAHANVDYRARSGRTISSISILRYVSRIDALFTAHTHNVRIIAIDCIAFCPRRFVRHIHKIIAFFCHAHGNGVMQFAIHSTSTVLTNQFFIRDSRLLLSLSDNKVPIYANFNAAQALEQRKSVLILEGIRTTHTTENNTAEYCGIWTLKRLRYFLCFVLGVRLVRFKI